MVAKFEADYNLLRQMKEIDLILSEDSSFENKFKKEIEDHDQEIFFIREKIKEVEEAISALELEVKKAQEKIMEYKANQQKIPSSPSSEEDSMTMKLSIQLEEKGISKLNDELKHKAEELQILKGREVSIKAAFAEFKDLVNKNNTSSASEMQELRNKRLELMGKLGDSVADAYKQISSGKSIHFPIASLRNGICTNCNIENIISMQVLIKSMEEIVKCEHCGAILVDVIEDKSEEEADQEIN